MSADPAARTAAKRLAERIRDVPDFPKPGILFKDITPLLQDPAALKSACELLARPFAGRGIELVVGIESRGFIFGPPVALALGAGFGAARKLGKLPGLTRSESYDLEYGQAQIEMRQDSVQPGQRVLLIDDVIATGGTAAATARLVRALGGEVVAATFLIELVLLEGRKALDGLAVESVLRF